MNKKIENYKRVYNYCHNSNASLVIECELDKTSSIIRVNCQLEKKNDNSTRLLGISTKIEDENHCVFIAVTIDRLRFRTKDVVKSWIEIDEDMAYICISNTNEKSLDFSFEIWNACTIQSGLYPFTGCSISLKFFTVYGLTDKIIKFIVSDDMGVRSIKGNHLMAYPSQTYQGKREVSIYYKNGVDAILTIRFGWIIKDVLYPWSLTLRTSVLLLLLYFLGFLPLQMYSAPNSVYMFFITSIAGSFYYMYDILNLRTNNTPYKLSSNYHLWYMLVHVVVTAIYYVAWFCRSYDVVFQNNTFAKYNGYCDEVLKTLPIAVIIFAIIGIMEMILNSFGYWENFVCDSELCNYRFKRRINHKECRYTGRVFCGTCQRNICKQCLYYTDLINEKKESVSSPSLEFLPCIDYDNDSNLIFKNRKQRTGYLDFFGGNPYPITLEMVEKRDNTNLQVTFLEYVIKNLVYTKNPKILDAGCGYGRHATRLQEKGYDVTAVDMLFSNCEFVRNRNKKLSIFRSDLAVFDNNEMYDFIYSMYTSIGYDTNHDKRVLLNLVRLLSKNGIMCIDIDNACKKKKLIELTKERARPGICLGIKINYRNWRRYYSVSLKSRRIGIHTLIYKLYEDVELITMLNDLGLTCIMQYGDYSCNKYEEKSNRCILVFRKM